MTDLCDFTPRPHPQGGREFIAATVIQFTSPLEREGWEGGAAHAHLSHHDAPPRAAARAARSFAKSSPAKYEERVSGEAETMRKPLPSAILR